MKEYVCPHCLKKFKYNNFWFQCPKFNEKSQDMHEDLGAKGIYAKIATPTKKGEDSKYCAQVRRDMGYPSQENYGRDFIAEDFKDGFFKYQKSTNGNEVPKEAYCYYCNGITHTHICPNCHNKIDIDKNDKQFIINLAGAKSSGKSDFFGSLLYMIDKRLSRITNQWVVELDGHAKEYLDNFKQRIENKVGEGTIPGAKQDPAIVTFKKTEGTTTKKYTFIFYDIAGELLTENMSPADRVRHAKKFSRPDYIIYFSDPTRMSGPQNDVRNSRNEKISQFTKDFFLKDLHIVGKKDVEQNVSYIRRIKEFLGDVYYYNEEKSREEAYGKTDTPISVCLTMLDVLKDAYTDMEIGLRHYFRPSTYQNDYNIHRFLNHELPGKNKNLINQFIGWEESNFVNYINNNFGKNQFFGISALGTNDENLGIDMEYDFKPINVLDPFVWFIDEVAPELLENDENFKRLD